MMGQLPALIMDLHCLRLACDSIQEEIDHRKRSISWKVEKSINLKGTDIIKISSQEKDIVLKLDYLMYEIS